MTYKLATGEAFVKEKRREGNPYVRGAQLSPFAFASTEHLCSNVFTLVHLLVFLLVLFEREKEKASSSPMQFYSFSSPTTIFSYVCSFFCTTIKNSFDLLVVACIKQTKHPAFLSLCSLSSIVVCGLAFHVIPSVVEWLWGRVASKNEYSGESIKIVNFLPVKVLHPI